MKQLTLNDVESLSILNNLTKTKRSVLILVREGLPQALIARRLKISRSYVNQILKPFIEKNLLKPVKSERKNNQFFEISSILKRHLSDDKAPPISPIRTHNIIRKFRITRKSGELSKDKRTGYQRSWQLRGGERSSYWYPGEPGEISVTLHIHPHTVVAYMDKGQTIIAEDCEQAEQRGIQMVQNAVQEFIEKQRQFGVKLEVEGTGTQVVKTHFGVVAHKASGLYGNGQTTLADTWIDSSIKSEVEPDKFEWETTEKKYLTPFERGIRDIALVDRRVQEGIQAALPEALKSFEQQFAPLSNEVHQVLAYVQSGQSIQNQQNQLVSLVAQLIGQIHGLQDEIKEIKKGK